MDELELFASSRPEVATLSEEERELIRSQVLRALPGESGSQRGGPLDAGTAAGSSFGRRAARPGRPRHRVLLATAAVLVLAASIGAVIATRPHSRSTDVADVAGVGLADRPVEPGIHDGSSSRARVDGGFANGNAIAASNSAYCGFTIDQLRTAPWAIDGEVMSVTADGPMFWGSPQSLRVRIRVGTWLRGEGSEPEILIADAGELGLSGGVVRTGARVLAAGEMGPDGSKRAWACGFVIPWTSEDDAVWAGVFR